MGCAFHVAEEALDGILNRAGQPVWPATGTSSSRTPPKPRRQEPMDALDGLPSFDTPPPRRSRGGQHPAHGRGLGGARPRPRAPAAPPTVVRPHVDAPADSDDSSAGDSANLSPADSDIDKPGAAVVRPVAAASSARASAPSLPAEPTAPASSSAAASSAPPAGPPLAATTAAGSSSAGASAASGSGGADVSATPRRRVVPVACRGERSIPWGIWSIAEVVRSGTLIGWGATCGQHENTGDRSVCKRQLMIGRGGCSDECRRMLKAWLVAGQRVSADDPRGRDAHMAIMPREMHPLPPEADLDAEAESIHRRLLS
jgi:hypothetical protein